MTFFITPFHYTDCFSVRQIGYGGKVLDDLVYKELLRVKKMAHANWEAIDALAKDWAAQKFNAERQIDRLQERISVLKNEVEQILMERIRDKAHADIYDVMLQ